MDFIDMHIHLQDYKANFATDIITQATAAGFRQLVNAAAKESNWEKTASFARRYPDIVVPAFGLHPWYVDCRLKGWQERILPYFKAFPNALVGECGLDGLRRFEADQQEVFADQIDLAKQFKRPLVIHAVKADGLLSEFWAKLPAKFMFHSFNGRPEQLRPVIRRDGYVSLGFPVLKNRDFGEIAAAIPVDRLLVESDGPYQSGQPDKESTPLQIPLLLTQIAAFRRVDPLELAAQVYRNSREFIYGQQ